MFEVELVWGALSLATAFIFFDFPTVLPLLFAVVVVLVVVVVVLVVVVVVVVVVGVVGVVVDVEVGVVVVVVVVVVGLEVRMVFMLVIWFIRRFFVERLDWMLQDCGVGVGLLIRSGREMSKRVDKVFDLFPLSMKPTTSSRNLFLLNIVTVSFSRKCSSENERPGRPY